MGHSSPRSSTPEGQLSFTARLQSRREQWAVTKAWQGRLFNKCTAKRFASELGVPVPELYWCGSDPATLPPICLPSHFVVKPAHGHSGYGVSMIADGIDNLTGLPFDWQAARSVFSGKGGGLIEEYIPTSQGGFDVMETYKVFVFSRACVVNVNLERFDRARLKFRTAWQAFYTEQWERIEEPISSYAPPGPALPRPQRLENLIDYARLLARAYETFVRVDFLVSPTGVFFGEFCPYPWNGKHITAFGQRYLGALWSEHLDALA